ncbi:hypothetical protein FO519_008430 [Halicephalobus sp. NKZ332]|nr:hypothetical protein FO519_008430 [Halicephalobus sp. NKZ332]
MDFSNEFEVVVNPKPEVWYKFVDEYLKIRWTAFHEGYEYLLKNFDHEDLQFFAAFDKKTKEIAGSIQFGRYAPIDGSIDLVCIGKYFVMADRRGQGLGEYLWKTALVQPKFSGKNLGLIAAQAMTDKYRDRYGFNKFYKSDLIVENRKISDLKLQNLEIDKEIKILDFKDVDVKKVLAFDTKINGNQRRDKFLEDWLKMKAMKAVKVAMNKDQEVVGFMGLCEMGDIITPSPLFAMNNKIAATLLKECLESIDNLDSYRTFKTVRFEENSFSKSLFNQLTEEKTVQTKLYGQFTESVPDVDYDHVYCLTELGTNVI